ncbi:MAG: hypothetical protein IKY74_02385 [Alistipes sp.]|nr:hypothetical protein [Alistipes sp.]
MLSALIFVATLLLGLGMFAMAMVLALAEVIDHLALCYIIVGSVSIVVAVVVYLLWLRTSIIRIRRRIDTIYEVSSTFERCYAWVRTLLKEIVGGR